MSERNSIAAHENGNSEVVGILLELRQFPLSDSAIDYLPIGPKYTVTVSRSGVVTFVGESFVKTIGARSHVLDNQRLHDMLQTLRRLNLNQVKSSRSSAYYAHLSLSLDGQRDIDFDGSNVRAYVDFRNAMEPYLRTMDYRCPVDQAGSPANVEFCKSIFGYDGLVER